MHDDGVRAGPPGPHANALAGWMRAQEAVRIGVFAPNEECSLVGEGERAHSNGSSSSRTIAATGTATQSGRLSSS